MTAGSTFNFTVAMPDNTNGGSYFIAVPIGPSGMAFLGDTNKFVTRGKKRISSLSDTGLLRATIAFASGETNVTLCGHAPTNPFAFALAGSTNNLTFNPTTHFFTLRVSPDNSGTATVGFSLAPAPSLQINYTSAGQVQISWATNAVGYALQMATNLAPPVIWFPATNTVNSTNGQNIVTLNATIRRHFTVWPNNQMNRHRSASVFNSCNRRQLAAGSMTRAVLAFSGVPSFPGLGLLFSCMKPTYIHSISFYTTTLTPPSCSVQKLS